MKVKKTGVFNVSLVGLFFGFLFHMEMKCQKNKNEFSFCLFNLLLSIPPSPSLTDTIIVCNVLAD